MNALLGSGESNSTVNTYITRTKAMLSPPTTVLLQCYYIYIYRKAIPLYNIVTDTNSAEYSLHYVKTNQLGQDT